MKKALSVILCFALLSLALQPAVTYSQRRRNSQVTVPTDYHTNRERPDDSEIKVISGNLRIDTTAAEVRPGLYRVSTFAPGEDWAIEPVREPIPDVVVRDKYGRFTQGTLPTHDVNGMQIYVMYFKPTGEIEAIINCGNWAWSEYRFPVPEPEVIYKDREKIVYKDKEVYKDREKIVYKCEPDTWRKVIQRPEGVQTTNGGNVLIGSIDRKNLFEAHTVIDTLTIKTIVYEQNPGLLTLKNVGIIQIFQGVCEEERNRLHILCLVWDEKEKKWHWKEFWVGFAAGALVGFVFGRWSVNCPKPNMPQPKIDPGGGNKKEAPNSRTGAAEPVLTVTAPFLRKRQ